MVSLNKRLNQNYLTWHIFKILIAQVFNYYLLIIRFKYYYLMYYLGLKLSVGKHVYVHISIYIIFNPN